MLHLESLNQTLLLSKAYCTVHFLKKQRRTRQHGSKKDGTNRAKRKTQIDYSTPCCAATLSSYNRSFQQLKLLHQVILKMLLSPDFVLAAPLVHYPLSGAFQDDTLIKYIHYFAQATHVNTSGKELLRAYTRSKSKSVVDSISSSSSSSGGHGDVVVVVVVVEVAIVVVAVVVAAAVVISRYGPH